MTLDHLAGFVGFIFRLLLGGDVFPVDDVAGVFAIGVIHRGDLEVEGEWSDKDFRLMGQILGIPEYAALVGRVLVEYVDALTQDFIVTQPEHILENVVDGLKRLLRLFVHVEEIQVPVCKEDVRPGVIQRAVKLS